MNKKILVLICMILLIGILSLVNINSIDQTLCCEKTTDGAWCQNAVEEKCDVNFKSAPTSCESTSYCKLGCCFDNAEGTCHKNTPQRVCDAEGGVWREGADCDVSQCTLGCCLIGDQAAFVTQTRCKRMATLYGLEINFRGDINNEVQCILSASSDEKGACVYEVDFGKTCEFITQKECDIKGNSGNSTEFYAGTLCTAPELETDCAPTEITTCVDGKDGVYYTDTCGNVANIYDADKIDDDNYWTDVYESVESCNPDSSNTGSKTCGNCDYFLGSSCQKADRGSGVEHGNYICEDLGCEFEGNRYEHGETWCLNTEGAENNLIGSRYTRAVCYNGEVTIEPCADFRQEICIESDVNGFSSATCRVNRWEQCYSIKSKSGCENEDKRDCKWLAGAEECVPKYAPGFDFWNSEGDATGVCGSVSTNCVVTYEKKLGGDWECKENCECKDPSYIANLKKACAQTGDCGIKQNFVGESGLSSSFRSTKTEKGD